MSAGLIVPMVIGLGRSSSASPAAGSFTGASAVCAAYAGHYQPAPLGPLGELVPLPYGAEFPVVGPLVSPTEPVTSGSDCPASARTTTEQASAAASVDKASGRWSVQLDAAAGRYDSWASAGLGFTATIDAAAAGNLTVVFDEVVGEFTTSCDRCAGEQQPGYLTTVQVDSSAGSNQIHCGTGAFRGDESTYTLPDDRCGLDEHGNAAALPVGAGTVKIDIAVAASASVTGPGATGPASQRRATLNAAARIAAFDIEAGTSAADPQADSPSPSGAAKSESSSPQARPEPPPDAAVVDSATLRAPDVAVGRGLELPRAGAAPFSLVPVGGIAVLSGAALTATAIALDRRRHARLRAARSG